MPAFFALALLVSAACQKEDSRADSAVARAELDIRLSVDGGASVSEEQTKSVVTGSTLNESGRTYGIIACEHEDVPSEYRPYDYDAAGIYGNIQAWYGNYSSKGTGWWYSYESSASSRFKPLYFVTNNVSRHMDIYAYYPWKSGVTIETGYQYNLSSVAEGSLEDLMYATYEDEGGTPTNKDITLVDKATIPLKINFHHALSRIVCHFKLANAQNTGLDGEHYVNIDKMEIFRPESALTPLYSQGIMNLLSGEIKAIGYPSSFITRTGSSSVKATAWSQINMLLTPIEYIQNGDFGFRFYLYNCDQPIIQQYLIQRSDLLHSDGTYGFQPGYCYHFYFIIDNYIHLQNVVINTDWTLTDEMEILI